jgi:hypothetical protein
VDSIPAVPARLIPVDVEFVAPDEDRVYANYLETCRRAGVESIPRERAFALIQEYPEALSGRPDSTQH